MDGAMTVGEILLSLDREIRILGMIVVLLIIGLAFSILAGIESHRRIRMLETIVTKLLSPKEPDDGGPGT